MVKLTAQFVARNGRQFLTNLMNREQRNYQFDFLRPQHSLFNYFTKLVEQYTKVGWLLDAFRKFVLAGLKREFAVIIQCSIFPVWKVKLWGPSTWHPVLILIVRIRSNYCHIILYIKVPLITLVWIGVAVSFSVCVISQSCM